MLVDVMKRLEALGFTATSVDEWVLRFCIDKVENHIKNNCNLTAVPKGLREIAVDLICGEFLFGKMNTGALDYERAVKRIKEGDTDVEYAEGSSDAELIATLINDLRSRKIDFAAYRKIIW